MFGGEEEGQLVDEGAGYEEEVDEGGPCEKLGSSLCVMCLGCIGFPCILLALGWNENHYVCEDRRILYSDQKAEWVDCDTMPASNKFAFFSCPLYGPSLEEFQPCTFNEGKFACDNSVMFRSVSGMQTVEMYQCRETCSTEKKKDNLGRNKQVKKCSHKMEWSTESIPSTFTHTPSASACPDFAAARENPRFPDNLQTGSTVDYAQTVRTQTTKGKPAFTLSHDLVKRLTPDTVVDLTPFASNFSGTGSTTPWVRPFTVSKLNLKVSGSYLESCTGTPRLGCVRIQYHQSTAKSPSVVTELTNGGLTQKAKLPGSWGCSSTTWEDIAAEKMTKEKFIAYLRDRAYTTVWIIRILGIIGSMVAVCCCLQPIAAVADVFGDCINMIPCGGYLEDMLTSIVDWVICAVACPVGLGASLLVISTVWIFMRPAVGIGLLAAGLVLCCCAVAVQQMFGKSKHREAEEEEGDYKGDY